MEPRILNRKMPNGLDDIALYLNLNPEKTLFMHSTSFDENDPNNIKRKAINKGRMLYAEILSYSSLLKNGAKSVICYYNEELLDYYEKIGFINLDNIIKVGENKKIDFPYNSVSNMLNHRLKNDEELVRKLKGYTIVSSYLSKEDEESAKIIDGKLIMDRKEQEKFNSKYEFRRLSKKYNFSMPIGEYFLGINNLEKAINELNKKINKKDKIGVWIKLETQSSGTGNIFVKNLNKKSIEQLKEEIKEVGLKIYDIEYINYKMPLVIEIDVNSIENEEEIENIGVEAVIGKNDISILGGVSQLTENGEYLGSRITENTYKYLKNAEKEAEKAFLGLWKEGYRGFITIDVLVTKNKENNSINAYCIDPNARFSAGTMLLRNVHLAEEENNCTMYGNSLSTGIKIKENTLKTLKNAKANKIYNLNSKRCGIVPALINDVNKMNDGNYYLKVVSVDKTYEESYENYMCFRESLKGE